MRPQYLLKIWDEPEKMGDIMIQTHKFGSLHSLWEFLSNDRNWKVRTPTTLEYVSIKSYYNFYRTLTKAKKIELVNLSVMWNSRVAVITQVVYNDNTKALQRRD